MKNNNEKITIAVSGGFDPVHVGHVRMFEQAKKFVGPNGRLVVILNNDKWLEHKKGHAFMSEIERAEVIKSIRWVDDVIITNHSEAPEDVSVCDSLREIKPHIFANGGDRKADNIPEYSLCEELGIEMIFNIGGEKAQSSSELVKRVMKIMTEQSR